MKKYFLPDGSMVMVIATTKTPTSTEKLILLSLDNELAIITWTKMITTPSSRPINLIELQQISELATNFDVHWKNIFNLKDE